MPMRLGIPTKRWVVEIRYAWISYEQTTISRLSFC